VTLCYDCQTLLTDVNDCRVVTISGGEVALVLCLTCSTGRPGETYKPADLPSRSRYELGGGSA
jgi:RNase P subunit RPR2